MGHKTLLTTALSYAERILLCVTTDEYVRRMHKIAGNLVESEDMRRSRLMEFLDASNNRSRATICSIDDPYSMAVSSKYAGDLDAIVISEDPGVVERTLTINMMREEKGLKPLQIIQIPLIRDPYGKIFSSTRYRLNDFFPEPRPPEFKVHKNVLDDIRRPKGRLARGPDELPDPRDYEDTGIIVVGDIALRNIARAGYPISVAIIDLRARRKNLSYSVAYSVGKIIKAAPAIPAFNPPGTISTFSWFSVMVAYVQQTPTVVYVFGEEDLLGFPATILAPTGSLIIYGDPFLNKLVYFVVDEEHRWSALEILQRMTISRVS